MSMKEYVGKHRLHGKSPINVCKTPGYVGKHAHIFSKKHPRCYGCRATKTADW